MNEISSESRSNQNHIAVSGTNGLVGNELCNSLKKQGHHIVRIARKDQPLADVIGLATSTKLY